MPNDVVVTDAPEMNRYEARVGGELAGIAAYRLTDDHITFVHTKVEPAFEGHGVGGALVKSALDDVAAQGTRTVIAQCPFVAGWIDRHRDYQYLLQAPGNR